MRSFLGPVRGREAESRLAATRTVAIITATVATDNAVGGSGGHLTLR